MTKHTILSLIGLTTDSWHNTLRYTFPTISGALRFPMNGHLFFKVNLLCTNNKNGWNWNIHFYVFITIGKSNGINFRYTYIIFIIFILGRHILQSISYYLRQIIKMVCIRNNNVLVFYCLWLHFTDFVWKPVDQNLWLFPEGSSKFR